MKRFQLIIAAGAVFAAGALAGAAIAAQPHMQAAIDYLKSARSELVSATPNKGGHRAKAIQLVDQAISETRTGMDVAD